MLNRAEKRAVETLMLALQTAVAMPAHAHLIGTTIEERMAAMIKLSANVIAPRDRHNPSYSEAFLTLVKELE